MSTSPSSTTTEVSPQQIGKAFVVQYYRLLHEHPESLHRFYSTSSTLMHDDPNKTAVGTEEIAKRIEQLSLKQRHVKIRQVDCHSTVGSSVVVQVCGEISAPVIESTAASSPTMKRFVQTFVLAPTDQAKQKYYVHNDIFRYQDTPMVSTPTTKTESHEATVDLPTTPSTTMKVEFLDNTLPEKKETKTQLNVSSSTTNMTPPVTPNDNQEKEPTSKPKSYRDAIGKTEKPAATNNETSASSSAPPIAATSTAATATGGKSKKANKQQQKAAKANASTTNRATRGHPQDANDYYDDSWYYGSSEEGYLSTGYTDDQEVFVGHLSAQVTENEIRELFRSYGNLLHIRIGNTGSQVGPANFAFVVCQSIEMAQAIVADREHFLKTQKVEVEAKKRRPFAHTFRPTYPTAASPASYQSTGYSSAFYNQSSYYGNAPPRGGSAAGAGTTGGRRGGGATGRGGGASGAATAAKQ